MTAVALTGTVRVPWLVASWSVEGYVPARPGSKCTEAVTAWRGARTVPAAGRPVTVYGPPGPFAPRNVSGRSQLLLSVSASPLPPAPVSTVPNASGCAEISSPGAVP